MKPFNLQNANYSVSGLDGFTLDQAARLWKAKFDSITQFKRDVANHPGLEELGQFFSEIWDSIESITVQEALQEQNMETRRVMFECIGVSRLFKQLDPALLDKQVLTKVRTRWREDNHPYEYTFEDTYELYRVDGKKLFTSPNEWAEPNPIYAVHCWCTTTAREYWIYVPEEAALGDRRAPDHPKPDAIRAIAWTIRLDITNPKRLYRQGDIIVAEESDDSVEVPFYHLTKEDYLRLMFSET